MDLRVEEANGYAERRTALAILAEQRGQGTARNRRGGCELRHGGFVRDCRAINVTPHIAQTRDTPTPRSMPARRDAGYLVSQRKRKLVEEIFG